MVWASSNALPGPGDRRQPGLHPDRHGDTPASPCQMWGSLEAPGGCSQVTASLTAGTRTCRRPFPRTRSLAARTDYAETPRRFQPCGVTSSKRRLDPLHDFSPASARQSPVRGTAGPCPALLLVSPAGGRAGFTDQLYCAWVPRPCPLVPRRIPSCHLLL